MTRLYKLTNGVLVPVPQGLLAGEDMIEGWVAEQPSLLGLDILVIGRQVITDFGGRIDLLGIDSEGSLSIVELKRDRTPREVVAKSLTTQVGCNRLPRRKSMTGRRAILDGALQVPSRNASARAHPNG